MVLGIIISMLLETEQAEQNSNFHPPALSPCGTACGDLPHAQTSLVQRPLVLPFPSITTIAICKAITPSYGHAEDGTPTSPDRVFLLTRTSNSNQFDLFVHRYISWRAYLLNAYSSPFAQTLE